MKRTRIALIAALSLALLPFAGCALYKNPSACETQMRDSLARISPNERLKVSNAGAGIGGSHVVAEGTLERPLAASAPTAGSAAAASATATASPAATAPPAKRNAAPRTASRPAAAECTFNGEALTAMHWLKPAAFAAQTGAEQSDSEQQ